MLLLILLCIVFVITVFMLGSYYAKVESATKSGYPTREDRCRIRSSCGGTSGAYESKASTASGTTEKCDSTPAAVDEDDDRPCKNHMRLRCQVCYKKQDDGFSSNGIIISTPAPF
jgi:hypothetical protein